MSSSGEHLELRVTAAGILLGVRVRPGAAATRPVGLYGDRLKVDVAAPPEAGRANRELARGVAGWLGVSPDDVTVTAGRAGRDKVLAVRGVEEATVRDRLEILLDGVSRKE